MTNHDNVVNVSKNRVIFHLKINSLQNIHKKMEFIEWKTKLKLKSMMTAVIEDV
jgi:hypothetical protein